MPFVSPERRGNFGGLSLQEDGEGDAVAVEARSRGMHVSGREYSNEYHFLFRFRDGLIVRLKEYMDTERVTDVLCGGQRPARAD